MRMPSKRIFATLFAASLTLSGCSLLDSDSQQESGLLKFGETKKIGDVRITVTNPKSVKAKGAGPDDDVKAGDHLTMVHVKVESSKETKETYGTSIELFAGDEGESLGSTCDSAVGTNMCGDSGRDTGPGMTTTTKFGYKVAAGQKLQITIGVNKKSSEGFYDQVGAVNYEGTAN